MLLRSSLALHLLIAPLAAQTAQDAPPVDVNRLLHELQQIGAKNEAATKSRQQKILSDLQQAASSGSSAINFYEQAVRATQHPSANDFQEWKKKEAEKLRSNEMQNAAQMHLRYLSLSLRHAWGTPAEDLLGELFPYTHALAALIADEKRRPGFLAQDLLRKRLNDSVFVRWYNLQSDLPPAKEWELIPGNYDGIYERTILPVMRSKKDTRIVEYWDLRIQREEKRAEENKLAFGKDQFSQVERPALLWKRAKDLIAVGLKNRAMNDMFAVIRAHPEHKEASQWISELQKLAAPPAPAATPAAPAAP